MLGIFSSTPNVLRRLLIVLVFVGGFVFAGAFGGFVGQTDAKTCCPCETQSVNVSNVSNLCDKGASCTISR